MANTYPPHKCLLDGCNSITRNAKYCCAEHAREAQRIEHARRFEAPKVCPCCGEEKPGVDFYIECKGGQFHVRAVCQECIDTGRFRSWKSSKAARTQKEKNAHGCILDGYLPTFEGWGNIHLDGPDPFATPVAA